MKVTKDNFDEARYREKLRKVIPGGAYKISGKKFTVFTGSGGMIEFEVAFIKRFLEEGLTFEESIYE